MKQSLTDMRFQHGIVLLLMTLLMGCSSSTIKSNQPVELKQETVAIPSSQLLDVGIQLFDPNLDYDYDEEDMVFEEIRNAESRFMPLQLMKALQATAAWGAVRVVPITTDISDVAVHGIILESDGEKLSLSISVNDATGRHWFTRKYSTEASMYAYQKSRSSGPAGEPFQSIYNQIANDMLEYRRENLSATELTQIRTIAELRFAKSFSPNAFGDYVQEQKGQFSIVRLPAENDPMLQRIRTIRERDYLFIDTMQGYYGNFQQEMLPPYQQWRSMSYNEAVELRELRKQATINTILGVAAVVAGVAGAVSNDDFARASSGVAITGGSLLIKSGFDKRAQSEMHVEALMELGESLESTIEPQVIELEDRSITLSGTVENQYQQWRDLLRQLYILEVGQP